MTEVKDFFFPHRRQGEQEEKMNVLVENNTNTDEGHVNEDLDQFINPLCS